jgi:transposase
VPTTNRAIAARSFRINGKRASRDGSPEGEPMDVVARREQAHAAVALAGVDAEKFHHAMVVRDARGRDAKPLLFPTTREGFDEALHLIRVVSNNAAPADVLVGIEFAGTCGATFAHYLDAAGYPIVSVLGATTKAWGRAIHGSLLKTDAKDATTIVDLVSHGRFTGYPFLRPEYAKLRVLTAGVRRLTLLRTATVNRLRSVLQSVWPEYETHFSAFTIKITPLRFLKEFPGPQALIAAPKRRVLKVLATLSRGYHGEEKYAALLHSARSTVAIPGAEQALATELQQLLALTHTLHANQLALEDEMVAVMSGMPDAAA